MDAQTFNAFLEGKLNDIRDILASKGAEYVPEGTVEKSRFHNFEVSAALNGSTKEQALWGFVTKHIVSLADMIKDEPLDHSLAKWDEKIGDISVYLVLLHAMVYEAHDNADMVKEAMKEYADHVSSLEDVSVKSDEDKSRIEKLDEPSTKDVQSDVVYPEGYEGIRTDLENKTVQAAKINIPEGLSDADKQHRAWMARVTPPQHS